MWGQTNQTSFSFIMIQKKAATSELCSAQCICCLQHFISDSNYKIQKFLHNIGRVWFSEEHIATKFSSGNNQPQAKDPTP
jgi:hypothetical protein